MTTPRASSQIQLFATDAVNVKWRLLNGNNREAGRGLLSAADPELCLEGIERLRLQIAALEARVRRVHSSRWMWELSLDGAVIVVAGHPYDRAIRCRQSLTQFLADFPLATVRPGVVVSGSRRWQRSP